MDETTNEPTVGDILTNLLTRVAGLEARLEEHVGYGVYFGGQMRVMHAAVMALVLANPKPEELVPTLESHIEGLINPVVPHVDPRHVQGITDARDMLNLAMQAALAMNDTAPAARH